MTAITVVGGVYPEKCSWPEWDMIFGSGGRAASALGSLIDDVELISYATSEVSHLFQNYASLYGFRFKPQSSERAISFDYLHPMSVPTIRPTYGTIRQNPPIHVNGDVILRFGMLEGTAVVDANVCVYDPQDAFSPQAFHANGSSARRLAVVANSGEIAALAGNRDRVVGARAVLEQAKAAVVVVKAGLDGALVVTGDAVTPVPAFKTTSTFTIGSGDVFAAVFAALWGVEGRDPVDAARLASIAVADYVEDRNLPARPAKVLEVAGREPLTASRDRVYLAGPFFTMAQLWMIDEARRCLSDLGMEVFSPFHQIGPGPAEEVGPADIQALKECNAVFAILDGLDSGTVFEVGYARAIGKPVVGFSQVVPEEDLKMIAGSDCTVISDFVSALVAVAAR